MLPTRINFPGLSPAAGPYCHAVLHAGTLYTSGLTAYGTDRQSANAGDQTEAVLDQLSQLAKGCGASMETLVKVTLFAVDPEDIPEIRSALTRRYGTFLPASSLVLVKSLFAPDLRIEMEAIFALTGKAPSQS